MTKTATFLVGNYETTVGITKPYIDWVSQWCKIRLFTPYTDQKDLLDTDVIILVGGSDIAPTRYNGVPSVYTQSANPFMEWYDANIMRKYIGEIPMFGICRGFQSLLVEMGCEIEQHLYNHEYSSKGRDDLVHTIGEIGQQKKTIKVNSLHHQGFKEEVADTMGFSLALSSQDEILEAFLTRDRMVAGVQWHPEEIFDMTSKNLFKSLLRI